MRLLAGGLPLLRLQIERLIQRRSKLIVFALALLANSVSIANVFPYAPYLVLHLGLTDDKRKLGFYAGYLMASYQLGQLLSSYPLGKLSESPKFGRKKVMLLGLASCTLPQIVFGSSPSFALALAMRFLMGLLNGIVIAAKAMVSDLVPPHEQGMALSLIASMWGLGNIIGPALGGVLSETVPSVPYLLPNLICAVFALLIMIPAHRFLPGVGSPSSSSSTSTDQSVAADAPMSPPTSPPTTSPPASPPPPADAQVPSTPAADRSSSGVSTPLAKLTEISLASPDPEGSAAPAPRTQSAFFPRKRPELSVGVRSGADAGSFSSLWAQRHGVPRRARAPLILYALVAGCSIVFDEVLPLWCVAPVSHGGLGFSTADIGVLLTVAGIALFLFQLYMMPCLLHRNSPTRLFKQTTFSSAVCYMLLPLVARAPSPALRWTMLIVLVVLMRCVQGMAFMNIFVMINNSMLAGERARVQALALNGAAGLRTIGPVLGATLFAWSLTNGSSVPGLEAAFIFVLSTLISVAAGVASLFSLSPDYVRASDVECRKRGRRLRRRVSLLTLTQWSGERVAPTGRILRRRICSRTGATATKSED